MARALWHDDSLHSSVKEESLAPIANANQQFYTAVASMISTGTERLVASGKVSAALQDKMAVPHMQGNFALPIKYGYSLIVRDDTGRLGHIMHPHQTEISSEAHNIYWTEKNILAPRFSLISNMETVINAIWDSNPTKDDKIAICGYGNIGALLAHTLRIYYDIDVNIIEIDKWRKNKAEALGYPLDNGSDYDIIYHTTVSPKGMQYCIDHLNHEGRLIELSWYGDQELSLSLGHNFHYNRLRIISSQVSVIPGHMSDEYDYKSRKDLALQYLLDPAYDDLITNTISFDDAPNFYRQLRQGNQGNGLIWTIEY